MAYNTSSAYDLSMYQPAPKTAPKPKLQVVEKKSAKRTLSFAFTPRALGAFAIVVTLVCLMVYNQVCLNEISGEINSIQSELTQMESEYVKMNSEMEAMVSLQIVAQKAKDELGMNRLDKYQTKYINLYGEDKIITADSGQETQTAKGESMSLLAILNSALEYISR